LRSGLPIGLRSLPLAFAPIFWGAERAFGADVDYGVLIHGSLRVTPAIAAGVTDHVWNIEEVLNVGASA